MPRSGRTVIAGERNGALLVRVAAAPVEGAANASVIELLAGVLGVPRRAVTIVRGEKGREKAVAVDGIDVTEAAARIEPGLEIEASDRGR